MLQRRASPPKQKPWSPFQDNFRKIKAEMSRLPGYGVSWKKRKKSSKKRGGRIRQEGLSSYQHPNCPGRKIGHTVIFPSLFHAADHLRQNLQGEYKL